MMFSRYQSQMIRIIKVQSDQRIHNYGMITIRSFATSKRRGMKHERNMRRSTPRSDPGNARGKENYADKHHYKPSEEFLDFMTHDLKDGIIESRKLEKEFSKVSDFSKLDQRVGRSAPVDDIHKNYKKNVYRKIDGEKVLVPLQKRKELTKLSELSQLVSEISKDRERPVEDAIELLEEMKRTRPQHFLIGNATSSVVSRLANENRLTDAMNLVQTILVDESDHVNPNVIAALFDGCARRNESTRGLKLYDAVVNKLYFPMTLSIYRSLSKLCAKGHALGYRGLKLLNEFEVVCAPNAEITLMDTSNPNHIRKMREIRSVYHNVMTAVGRDYFTADKITEVYERFMYTKLPPNTETLSNMLRGFATHGDMDGAEHIWAELTEDYNVVPCRMCYTTLIYVYARYIETLKTKQPKKKQYEDKRPPLYNEAVNLVRQLENLPDDAYFTELYRGPKNPVPFLRTIEEEAKMELEKREMIELEMKNFSMSATARKMVEDNEVEVLRRIADDLAEKGMEIYFDKHVDVGHSITDALGVINWNEVRALIRAQGALFEDKKQSSMITAHQEVATEDNEQSTATQQIQDEYSTSLLGELDMLLSSNKNSPSRLSMVAEAELPAIPHPGADGIKFWSKVPEDNADVEHFHDDNYDIEEAEKQVKTVLFKSRDDTDKSVVLESRDEAGDDRVEATLAAAAASIESETPDEYNGPWEELLPEVSDDDARELLATPLETANMIFDHALEHDIRPDIGMVNALLRCYTNDMRLNMAPLFLEEKCKMLGVKPDAISYLALVEMYAKACRVDKAIDVYETNYEELSKNEQCLEEATGFIVNGLVKKNRTDESLQWLRKMHEKNMNISEKHVRSLRRTVALSNSVVEKGLIPADPLAYCSREVLKGKFLGALRSKRSRRVVGELQSRMRRM